ncbi:MAG: DUF29 domain-containing protein, partial [Pseudomonadota bacterium]
PAACDLAVYDNSEFGGFLDKQAVMDEVGALANSRDVRGRFRQVHIIFERIVFLDVVGNDARRIDLFNVYEIDYAGWVFDQVERLRCSATEALDLNHIAEELHDLGKSEQRALGSHLRTLMLHLLKWQFQPDHRTESWRLSIELARVEVHEKLTESPSLRGVLAVMREEQYRRARDSAARETGLLKSTFPENCPYTGEQLIDPEYLPGERE